MQRHSLISFLPWFLSRTLYMPRNDFAPAPQGSFCDFETELLVDQQEGRAQTDGPACIQRPTCDPVFETVITKTARQHVCQSKETTVFSLHFSTNETALSQESWELYLTKYAKANVDFFKSDTNFQNAAEVYLTKKGGAAGDADGGSGKGAHFVGYDKDRVWEECPGHGHRKGRGDHGQQQTQRGHEHGKPLQAQLQEQERGQDHDQGHEQSQGPQQREARHYCTVLVTYHYYTFEFAVVLTDGPPNDITLSAEAEAEFATVGFVSAAQLPSGEHTCEASTVAEDGGIVQYTCCLRGYRAGPPNNEKNQCTQCPTGTSSE